MSWYNRLVNWSRSYDSRKFGLRGVWQCCIVAIAVPVLGCFMVLLFPGQRRAIATTVKVMLGLGLGFVYERNYGPPALLLIFTLVMLARHLARLLEKGEHLRISLALVLWVAGWAAVPMLGFILSYLVRCCAAARRGES